MDKKEWKKKITTASKNAGTYQKYFEHVIDTLAGILARRDEIEELYEKTGGNALIKHTNKSGATNIEQNPALRLINDLNRDALAYWKELGLTSASLKRINEAAMVKKEKESALAEALRKFGGA